MKIKRNLLNEVYFQLLVFLLLVAVVYIFAPFFSVILVAFILVEFFYPIYKRLAKHIDPSIASLLTTLLSLLTVVLPVVGLLLLATTEAISFGSQLQDFLVNNGLINENGQLAVERIKDLLTALNIDSSTINLRETVVQFGGLVGQLIYATVSVVINNAANILVKGFFMIFTMFYLFKDYDKLGEKLKAVSPLPDDLDEIFIEKFVSTTRAVIKGTFVVAVLQATAVTVVLSILGVQPIILWWMIMVILSLIPVGSGFVWFPLGLILMISGRTTEGVFLIIYSAIIINLIDTIVRPMLTRGGTNLHPIVALFSALGGLTMFGLVGLIYGPLIAVFFATVMSIYRKRYTTIVDTNVELETEVIKK